MGIKVIEFKTEYRTGKDPVDWVLYTGTDSITESGQIAAATWERVEKLRPPPIIDNDGDGLKMAAIRHLWDSIEPKYNAWKQGEAMPETGTPLAAWGGVSATQIDALKGVGIKTVEDLAGLSDSNMKMVLPNMRDLRTMAKQWMERRPEAEREAKLAELEAQNAAMMEMLAELQSQRFQGGPYSGGGDALAPLVEAGIIDQEDKPRRGRPPKAEAA
jgi:hypothetical protein